MLIEECMILTNEEVAKWCDRHGLPFLSRIHGLPGAPQLEIIEAIIGKRAELFRKKGTLPVTPRDIRAFLDAVDDERELYRFSRLLLPKMAKAHYSDKRSMHFGLALEYYSHFTSPIRRYPDLQVHRIIKEKLRGTLTPDRVRHYQNLLKKVAKQCSQREKKAEDIERVFDALYACRYMLDKVGITYQGRVSGMTEYALYVELESGIEGTLPLPRGRYVTDHIGGILRTE